MKRLITSLFLLSITVAGCSPEIVTYSDYDNSYNLLNYNTYDWDVSPETEKNRNPLYFNELNDKRIKAATEFQLTKKGYLLNRNDPDLLIHYHIVVEDRTTITTDPYGFYGPYWRHPHREIYNYREGTLILDFMDAKNNHLIWRGWAVSVINQNLKHEDVEKLIKLAVEKIFQEFPENYELSTMAIINRKR